jgi:hypothetical protein
LVDFAMSITGVMLIGQPDSRQPGIIAKYELYLEEIRLLAGKLPVQVKLQLCRFATAMQDKRGTVSWWSTPEYVVEDALLMIAVHVLGNQDIVALAKSTFPGKSLDSTLNLGSDCEKSRLERLHHLSRRIDWSVKVIFTVMKGSVLLPGLKKLGEYKLPSEICIGVSTPGEL